MATLKDGTTVGGSLVHTHKTLPILIIDGNLTHGGAVVFDTKNRPSFSSLTDNVIDVRTDSVIINTSKGNTSATIYDNGVFELKKAHVPYFTVEATGNIIGKIEWSRVQSKPIVGTTGTSTTNIMHQKAVTDGLAKKMDTGDFGLGRFMSMEANPTPLDFSRVTGFEAYAGVGSGSGQPPTSSSGDTALRISMGKDNNTLLYFNQASNKMYYHMRAFGRDKGWEEVATVDELNKINDGIKNRLIKDGGKLITTGSAETLLDNVDLGDYNQYMFTNNQYLGLESPTNFYIQTMEAEDQSIVQMGYPIMTQRAMERGVPNRIIVRNRHPWRDATNAIKRHDWTDWSLTLVNQDLTKTIANSVANSSDEKIPTEKAVKRELNKMIVGGSVVQVGGTSTVNVPSQKFVTDELNNKNNIEDTFQYKGNLEKLDLNTLNKESDCGVWTNSMTANATVENNYPKNGLFAGHLEVFRSAGITQVYTTYNISQRVFKRNNYPLGSDKWTNWVEVLDQSDIATSISNNNNSVPSVGAVYKALGNTNSLDFIGDGKILKEGAYGIGGYRNKSSLGDIFEDGLTFSGDPSSSTSPFGRAGAILSLGAYDSAHFQLHLGIDNGIKFRKGNKSTDKWEDHKIIITEDNVVQTGGTSTVNVPSQKFVTDQLGTKIDDHGALGTKNLDTVTQYGMHYQSANANATTARKYPVPLAGTLWVLPSAGVTQIYITYNQGQRTYTRNNYGDKWSNWVETLDMTDIVSTLGTATNKVVSQKIVNDVSIRTTTAQTRADSAWTLGNNALAKEQNLKDLTNVATARTNLGLGTSAIRNISTSEGTSTAIVASQALVNNVKTQLNADIGKKADTLYVNTELGKKRNKSDNTFPSIYINTDKGRSTYGLSAGGIPFVSIKVGTGAEQYANFQNKTGTIALTSDVSSNKVKYASVKVYRYDQYNAVATNPFNTTRIWGYFKSGSTVGIIPITRFDEKLIFTDSPVGVGWDVHIWTDI